jgi:general secretion pathway protein J
MKTTKKNPQNKGFSLIEVLVAMAITSIIVVSVYFSFSNILNGRAIIKKSSQRIRSVYFTLALIKSDLRNAYLTTNKGAPEETHDTIFKGVEDTPVSHLTFASLNHVRMKTNSKECDQTEIEYYGENIDGKNVLFRRESPWVDDMPEKGGNVFPLLKGFEYIKFEYWDKNNKEWKGEWNTKSVNTGYSLPPKIKITMMINEATDDKPEFKIETVVYLKMLRPFTF